MTPDELGNWGSGLDDRTRGRALAAAGVLTTARPRERSTEQRSVLASALASAAVPWSLPADDVGGLDPAVLAEDWETEVWRWRTHQTPGARLRLALEPPPAGGLQPAWLLERLAGAEPGSIALYERTATPRAAIRWGWPLDVGVAPSAGAAAIRQTLEREGHWWAERFTSVAPAATRAAPVDLMLAGVDDREGIRSLLNQPLRAGSVLLLRPPGTPWTPDAGDLEAIRDHAIASAVGVVQLPGDALASWMESLLFELSHDNSLDVALALAAEDIGTAPPWLLSDEPSLDSTRLSTLVRQLRRRTETVLPPAIEPALPEHDLGPRQVRADRLEGLAYDHESTGATVQALETPALERELDLATAPRFIQAGITADRDPAPERFLGAVTAGRPFFVHARIGPADDKWASADAAVPEDDLEFRGGEEPVTAILLVPELLQEPLVGALALPQSGPSEPYTFELPAPAGPGDLHAELLLLHEQRLLQTAVLSAPIVDAHAATVPGAGVEVSVGAVVRRSLHDLAGRRRFDAMILTGSATADDSAVAVTESGRVDFIAPAGWQVTAESIRDELNKATKDEWGTKGLRDRKVVDLLIKLANMGEPLHQALLNAWGEQTVKETGLLQVVAAQRGMFFPLEFVYDRPAPVQDADLCPNAEAALGDGTCVDCPSLDDDRFVCPLGFWGLARVIEHEDRSGAPVQWEFSILSEPTRARKRLSAPVGALVGVSEKVDKVVPDATTKLIDAVSAATGDAITVTDWAAWVERVEEKHPPLLVLVPHTEPHPFFKNVALEIGSELLAASQVKPKHVCPTKEHQPVVILLGCDTAAAASPLEGFPAQFHNDGAAIVLGTLTEVLGRHAAPVAGRIVEALVRRAEAGETYFGELVRDIRRRLLSEGLPLGLSLVAYGDADWVLPAR